MRRNDRKITDETAVRQFISGEKILRVGFNDNGEVYIVPVNYGYSEADGRYTFYFHGAAAGRKYELAHSAPSVGFEIDGRYELIGADTACGYSARFMSVIGTGVLSLIDGSVPDFNSSCATEKVCAEVEEKRKRPESPTMPM